MRSIRMLSRSVAKVIKSQEEMEGKGAKVRRTIGTSKLRNFDPFLLMDEFFVVPPAGFPDHPHRGFETVTYMLKGAFKHEDFLGHQGLINTGDIQWMTAGKGVVHSEMPASDGVNHGLQLWINLAKKDKMVDPSYQELTGDKIPKTSQNGVTVKVIAGESLGLKGPVATRTPCFYMDFTVENGAKFCQPVTEGWNVMAYAFSGATHFGPAMQQTQLDEHSLALFGDGNNVEFENKSSESSHFVLVGGEPINELIVQHGPFVMTTQEEIQQTFRDYDLGKNGFEGAKEWLSKRSKR